jgi:hypothetical protein
MAHWIHSFSQLPPPIQQEVADFVEFLLNKYRRDQPEQTGEKSYPLRGSVTSFRSEYQPVSEDDWEAMNRKRETR